MHVNLFPEIYLIFNMNINGCVTVSNINVDIFKICSKTGYNISF